MFALLMVAVAAAGCSSDNLWHDKPPTTVPGATGYTIVETLAPTTSAEVAAVPANTELRLQSCRDMLPVLDELRQRNPAAVSSAAEDTIANQSATPEWANMSQADRDATIAGIRDAAAGRCEG